MSEAVNTNPRVVVYYLTRDTNCAGELSPAVDVWYRKPIRHKLTFDRGYVWLPSLLTGDDAASPQRDLGYYGAYTPEQSRSYFGVLPETNLEMLRCEQNIVEPTPPKKASKR